MTARPELSHVWNYLHKVYWVMDEQTRDFSCQR